MSDIKQKAKEKIDATAEAMKRTSDNIIDKSKDAVHNAGKTMEKQGKRLQNA